MYLCKLNLNNIDIYTHIYIGIFPTTRMTLPIFSVGIPTKLSRDSFATWNHWEGETRMPRYGRRVRFSFTDLHEWLVAWMSQEVSKWLVNGL